MKILVACEESQAVTKELRVLGHEAYSCDIIECSGGHPEWHIMQDVIPLLDGNCEFATTNGEKHSIGGRWDMIIAFPPCTHLAVSGAPHFEKKRADGRQRWGIEFFCKFLMADCDKVAIENPVNIISGDYVTKWFPDIAEKYGLPLEPTQRIHPWMFGDNFSKNTCLWIKGLKPLIPETLDEPEMEWKEWIDKKTGKKKRQNLWYYEALANTKTPEERSKVRSKTFPGIAKAMAEQWAGESRREKEMELRIEKITFPEVIEFNFAELKQEITNRVAMYANMVYTEDQVKQAKADRANLNKFVKALSDERIKVKKQCLKPYEEFEAKVNELSKIVQEPIKLIDKQVKEYEEQKKRDKLDEITNFFNSTDHPEWLHISQIMNEKWLNASASMKSILGEIDSRLEQIKNDIVTLSNLPEFGFEATEVYKSSLDINKALNEGRRLAEIQKRKAEHEAEAKKQAEREVVKMPDGGVYVQDEDKHGFTYHEPQKQWVSFSALLSTEDAMALKAFFENRQIEFKAI